MRFFLLIAKLLFPKCCFISQVKQERKEERRERGDRERRKKDNRRERRGGSQAEASVADNLARHLVNFRARLSDTHTP